MAGFTLNMANAKSLHNPVGTITSPADEEWGDLYLVEIELPKARPDPDEYYCPPYDEDAPICLGASIIYRKAKVLRVLASSTGASLPADKVPADKVEVKGIGPHAAKWVGADYAVALLEKTDDGHYWMPVQSSIVRGVFCLSKTAIDHFDIALNLRPRASGLWESCFRIGK